MIKKNIKLGIDQTVKIGEFHIEAKLSMDKTIEECCNMSKIIEETLGEEILEKFKITEVRILEVDVDLEKDSIQVTLEEMAGAVVDLDQV